MDNRNEIRFVCDGQEYIAGPEFYGKDRVVLPNGTVLDVDGGWSETAPPQPRNLKVFEMPGGFSDWPLNIAHRAHVANAAIAREV